MKHIIYSLILGSVITFASCEDKLNEKHDNPDGFTTTKIEYLFSQGAQYAIENDYADCYNFTFRLLSTYTQTGARREGKDRINVYDIQTDKDRWENYYVKRMSPLSEINNIYQTLDAAKQAEYKIYIEATKVLGAYNTAIGTDFFGNMPYSEAFTARDPLYGGTVNFRPKYDSQKDIYYAILEDLKTAAVYFKTAVSTSTFDHQDLVYGGNTKNWYKFINSLRVRYAMRISYIDPAKAREVLSDISVEDLITANSENAYIKVSGKSVAPDGIWRALKESHTKSQGYYCYAPEKMVNLLKGASDPRLQVFFQPASDDEGKVIEGKKDIVGYPASADAAITLVGGPLKDSLINIYGVYNSTTFRFNYYLPVGVGMTAAETYFCLAEAAFRGLYSGSAEEFYTKGVLLSVQNYYDYYVNSDADIKELEIVKTDVSTETLTTWLASSSFKYDASKALEQIATQKWMHLGILQPFEGWAEYRRTDLPVLDDDRENGSLLNKGNAPVRFLYASKEASMNTENYNAQSEFNKPHVRLWWDVK